APHHIRVNLQRAALHTEAVVVAGLPPQANLVAQVIVEAQREARSGRADADEIAVQSDPRGPGAVLQQQSSGGFRPENDVARQGVAAVLAGPTGIAPGSALDLARVPEIIARGIAKQVHAIGPVRRADLQLGRRSRRADADVAAAELDHDLRSRQAGVVDDKRIAGARGVLV